MNVGIERVGYVDNFTVEPDEKADAAGHSPAQSLPDFAYQHGV